MTRRAIEFMTEIRQFGQAGEKTGWIHIIIPADLAQKLNPGNKKSFRVKGSLDNLKIERLALLPMGGGDFVLPINATMRKGIRKGKGAKLTVRLETDNRSIEMPEEFVACLKDDPDAYDFFNSLPAGHQRYFGKWIDSAKTDGTRTKRIAQAINALAKKRGFPEMLRSARADRDELFKK